MFESIAAAALLVELVIRYVIQQREKSSSLHKGWS